jgi:hypothetical protein
MIDGDTNTGIAGFWLLIIGLIVLGLSVYFTVTILRLHV